MAAHVIGKVQALQGIVQVRDQNGKIHNLMVGDELLEGQVLLTGNGHLTIAFADGGTANIGAGQTVAITAELSAHFFPGADEAHVSGVASANAAAHAILHGGDLNQILDAPAAGADLANEGHSFVQLLRIVEAVDLGPGATTAGVTVAAFARESVLPIHEAQAFVNHTPDVTAPSAGGTVFEAGLPARDTGPAGSHSGDPNDPVTTTGTVSFNSPDGVQSITLGGHVLTGTSTTFTDATGSLTASYTYDAAHGTGTITYSYTLLNNTSGDGVTVTLPVVVTDSQGDANTATNVVVSVVNDVPTANPGSGSGVEGATVTGNVLTDGAKPDVFGADGPAAGGGVVGVAHSGDTSMPVTTGVDTAIAGSYGTLTVHDDGTYTYVGTPNTVPPAGATDTFIYTIKDGDGDLSTSTLTINLADAGLSATSPTLTVDEAALSTGSNPGSPAETAGGTLGVTGAVSYAFAAGHDGAGSHGTLTLHADGSYSYTLTSAENSGPIQGPNVVNGAETFFYTATDAQGNTVDGTIVVNIKDDVPTAYADSNSGADGATLTGNVLTDGVHADVFGADGPAAGGGVVGVSHSSDTSTPVTTGVDVAIAGSYGTLTVHGNGTYTYVGTPNAVPTGGATDTFTYTIKDGDGDLSTSMLSIALTPAVVTPPPLPPADHAPVVSVSQGGTVYEAGLPGGSGIGPTTTAASGTFTVADGDGLSDIKSVTINGTTITIAALQNSGTTPIDIHSANGTLEVTGYNSSTGVASYTYTLTSPETTNPAANDDHNTVNDSFTLKVTDNSNVSSAPATLVIGVVDDAPTAGNDSFTTTVGHAVSDTLAGNDVVGADTPGTWALGGTTPTHGTVTIDAASGSFTYTPNAGYQGTDSFSYTLTDHDGDVATATATVTVNSNGAPTIVVTDNNGATDGQVTVNEAGLATGTLHDGSNSTTGSIVVTAPNGLSSIDFGGTNVTAAQLGAVDSSHPLSIPTSDGTLTLTGFDAGTGTISYTYAIDHAQTGPDAASTSVFDTLNLTVHDSTSATGTGTFGATILDDAPTAGNDSFTTTVGHAVSDTLAGNDVVGADTPGTWALGGTTPTHGTVTIDAASGSFTYTPNAGYQGTDSFSYTLTDHDGDVATATATVTVNSNGAPTIVVTDNNGATDGQVTVNEAGLATGTLHDGSNSTTGSIVVTAPNGLSSIDFGGTNVTAAQLGAVDSSHPLSIPTSDGTLTLTGFDAGTGTISYTYAIDHAQTGPDAASTSVFDTLNLTVHDSTSATGTGTFGATILDDAPTAGNDSFTTTVGHAVSDTLAGNDVVGADTPGTWALGGTTPTHGTVTIDAASGSFTYTPNAGYQGTDSFSYTLTDHDGDVATATATVTVNSNGAPTIVVTDNNGATDGQVTVNEAGLATGTLHDGSNSTTGSIVVTAPNGLSSIDFGGTNVTAAQLGAVDSSHPLSIPTSDGTLTLTGFDAGTGTISYTYAIDHAQTGPDAASTSVFDTLNLTVHDSTSATGTGTFGATILDDAPTAGNDSFTTTVGHAVSDTLAGNDVVGADTPGTWALGGTTPTHGTVTIDAASGSFTYTPNAGYQGTDSFSYTLTDHDGDVATATATVTVNSNGAPTIVVTDNNGATDGQVTVNEAGLATGTLHDGSNSTTGSIVVTAPNGLSSIDFGGTNVTAAQLGAVDSSHPLSIPTSDGTLTLTGFDAGTGTISYTYAIDHAQTGPDAASTSVFDTLNLTVHDSTSATGTGTFGATILDDAPTAGNDSFTTTVGHAVSDTLAGNDVVGADTPGTWALGGTTPTHGTVTIDAASGSFTYTPNAGYQGTDSFSYTLTDHDGDVATATATVTVNSNGAPTIVVTDNNGATDGQVTVNEAGLATGTLHDGSNSTTGSIVVTAPNGLSSIDFGGTNVTAAQLGAVDSSHPLSIPTSDGTLTLTGFDAGTGTISYTYAIDHAQTGPDAASTSVFDTLNLTVHDSTSATGTGTFGATILDDAPTAYTVTNSGTEGGTVSGNVLTDGTQADVFGADGPSTVGGGVVGVAHSSDTTTAVTTGLNTPITGSYGTLTLHADGTYTYTGTPNTVSPAGATDTFTYTIQDGDGDQSTATLNINLSDSNVAPVVGTAMASVSEQGLPGGLPDANGTSTDTTNSATASGSISISDPGSTISSVTLTGPTDITSNGLPVTWTGNGTAGNPLVGHAGSTTIATVTIDNSGHYSFTLNGPIDQIGPNSNSGTMLPLNFGVTATNTASQTGSGTLTINVEDDHPVAQSTASFTESATNTNIQVILDVSGSMTSNHDGLNGTTRLTTAVEAIESLLNSYASTGNVMVNLVTFSSSAQQLGSSWLSIPDAKTYLNALTASGFTYYDSALNTAQTAYTTSGALTAANTQNVTYFVSDGAPTSGHSVSSTLQSTWQSFLTSHDILSYALGIGSGAEQAPLNPVAYNGQTSTDTDAVLVANIGQLSSVLEGTVQAPVHGNVISGQAGAGVGADGGFVQSITVEGTTYTFTPGTNSVSATGATNHGSFDSTSDALNVTTSTGGTWTFNMVSGAYSYQAPNVSSGQTESLGYVISDNDGDTANSSISVALANNAVYPPSDILFGGNDTLSASGSGTTAVANNSILFTLGAIDPSGSHFTFTNPNPSSHGSGSNVAYDTVTTYIESVNGTNNETFTINNSTDTVTTTALSYSSVQNLSINIQVADEHGQTRTETVDLRLGTNNGGDTLGSATDTNDQVIYGFGGNDTITGGKGNDALYGGAGTDTLIETSGTNRLIGGAGNDTMTGGTGSDTFVWHLADKGTSSSPAADTITNFDATHATSSSGDVLALNDLVPDAAWSGGASALASYLHFATTGSNVTVSISSTGNLTSGVDQTIVLQGVTLASLGTAGSGSADQQIIQSLLNNGHLVHNG